MKFTVYEISPRKHKEGDEIIGRIPKKQNLIGCGILDIRGRELTFHSDTARSDTLYDAYLDAIGADGMLFVGTKVKGLEMVRREWWCVFQKEEA